MICLEGMHANQYGIAVFRIFLVNYSHYIKIPRRISLYFSCTPAQNGRIQKVGGSITPYSQFCVIATASGNQAVTCMIWDLIPVKRATSLGLDLKLWNYQVLEFRLRTLMVVRVHNFHLILITFILITHDRLGPWKRFSNKMQQLSYGLTWNTDPSIIFNKFLIVLSYMKYYSL